jgi:CHAT domain-containing protein
MQPQINQLYKFDQFCLYVSERVLKRDGRVAPLSPKLFEVLAQITFSTTIYSGFDHFFSAISSIVRRFLHQNPRRHPYYWASFIHSGEWTNLEGKR